jgi:DNA replication ATP-dependent helicase Dna2
MRTADRWKIVRPPSVSAGAWNKYVVFGEAAVDESCGDGSKQNSLQVLKSPPTGTLGDEKISGTSRSAEVKLETQDNENPRESLFRRLCEAHPASVVSLVKQYRMASDIMHLSNVLVYSGNLVCGTQKVSSQMLDISLGGPRNLPKWLKLVVNPVRRLIFLDTDGLGIRGMDNEGSAVAAGACKGDEDKGSSSVKMTSNTDKHGEEAVDGDARTLSTLPKSHRVAVSRQNPAEAEAIAAAVSTLFATGLNVADVAVLTPFRAQVTILRSALDACTLVRSSSSQQRVEVCTIDQYQGKDKQCVFVSFVRSNDANDIGPLLRDWRRVNVAITRAKSKLVLVGSATTLAGGCNFLSVMLEALLQKNAVVTIDSL